MSTFRGRGRPQEYDRDALAREFAEYIESQEIPIIAEFAYQHKIDMARFYDWPEFENLLKECIQKKQTALERKALKQDVNVTMAIFSLKQMGWSDKQETTHKGDAANPIVISEKAANW
jgi:hypothetical protein